MKKTNLGISVELLAAAIWFTVLPGGYVPAVLLTGYVLLFEWDGKLKRDALKAAVLLISFGAVRSAFALIPEIFAWLNLSVSLFGDSVNFYVTDHVVSVLTGMLDILKQLVFLLSGIRALHGGSVRVPFADALVKRHLEERD